MKVLIACEFSGIVRDAFLELGHDAYSCDLLPTESKPERHLQGDIKNYLNDSYNLLIAHPPCTYLCASGEQWLTRIPKYKLDPHINYGMDRFKAMEEAVEFFLLFKNAPIKYIAIENPRPMTLTKIKVGHSSQKIQPYEYGHLESKETHLWLKNLPKLVPTNNVYKEMMKLPIQERQKIFHMGGKNRGHERSRTYPGIARAMAEQWGTLDGNL